MLNRTVAILVALFICALLSVSPAQPQTLYVDDDSPNDPGPNDPNVSDPLEDGTLAHPFDSIQEAIDHAPIPCDVHVMPGRFVEALLLPYTGCSITGSGSTSTFLVGTGGTSISAFLYSDPNQPSSNNITALSIADGAIDIEASGAENHPQEVLRLADADLSTAPITIWRRWSSVHATLSSLTLS